MECRPACGACCVAPSISSPIPGMPQGKPAGIRCVQLNEQNLCRLFGLPGRPQVCLEFTPIRSICGETDSFAMQQLSLLESMTS